MSLVKFRVFVTVQKTLYISYSHNYVHSAFVFVKGCDTLFTRYMRSKVRAKLALQ